MAPPIPCWLRGHPSDQRGLLLSLQVDVDNVDILKTALVGTRSSAGVRPSPCMATTPQAIPCCPSTAQCSPADTPVTSPALQILPREPLAKGPCCIPILGPQHPLQGPGRSPFPSCASWPGPHCLGAGAQQLLHPIAARRPLPQGPLCFPLSSQCSPVPPVCL